MTAFVVSPFLTATVRLPFLQRLAWL